ncbi:hypothetical protein [Veillonella sp.]|nr:hypothetical protein [Veillonella sp.]
MGTVIIVALVSLILELIMALFGVAADALVALEAAHTGTLP